MIALGAVFITTLLTVVFFTIATPLYITTNLKNETSCLITSSTVKFYEDGCSQWISTTSTGTPTGYWDYYDCYSTLVSAIFNISSGEQKFHWYYFPRYSKKSSAQWYVNKYANGTRHTCWYLEDDGEYEMTFNGPDNTASIVLFSLGGTSAFLCLVSCFLAGLFYRDD